MQMKRKAEPRRGVPKDTWAMVLEFTHNVNSHFDNYDVEGKTTLKFLFLCNLHAFVSEVDQSFEHS